MQPEAEWFDSITASGIKIRFKDPWWSEISIEDIRAGCMNTCRYNGQVYWLLVKHLALCTVLAEHYLKHIPFPDRAQPYHSSKSYLIALAASHDFAEVILGDVVTGLKALLAEYKALEPNWEARVWSAFDIPAPFTVFGPDLTDQLTPIRAEFPQHKLDTELSFVKFIDVRALAIEMNMLNHGGAEFIASKFGAATEQEKEIFKKISDTSSEECWNLIMRAIEDYRHG